MNATMGCRQSTTLHNDRGDGGVFTPQEYRSYKCGNCNLLQRRTNLQSCLGCGAHNGVIFYVINADHVFPRPMRRFANPCWQQCPECQTLQYTMYNMCQFCLVADLMRGNFHSTLVDSDHNTFVLKNIHSLNLCINDDFSPAVKFIAQQQNKNAAGESWLLNSIYPLDPHTIPFVHASVIRTSLVNSTLSSLQVASSNRAVQQSKRKVFSMLDTDEIINQLAGMLESSRQHGQGNDNTTSSTSSSSSSTNAKDQLIQIASPSSSSFSIRMNVVEQAVFSIQCPICLEVYKAPITLPCGHSVCKRHAPYLKNKCPTCRSHFSFAQVTLAKNATLCRNISTVLELIEKVDPDQEAVRLAADRIEQ